MISVEVGHIKKYRWKTKKNEGIIELNENQAEKLRKLIERKVNETGIKLEPTHMTKHKIDVQGHKPIKQRYYHISAKVRKYMYYKIDKILEEHVIEPSNSDWSNPIVMMKKPNGKYRFCLDFRKVNKITEEHLGFIVKEKGLLMNEDKIKPILESPTPKNVKELQRIIGMTSWYRRLITKFSGIMEPLHTLLKKGVEWEWNVKQEQASEKIK